MAEVNTPTSQFSFNFSSIEFNEQFGVNDFKYNETTNQYTRKFKQSFGRSDKYYKMSIEAEFPNVDKYPEINKFVGRFTIIAVINVVVIITLERYSKSYIRPLKQIQYEQQIWNDRLILNSQQKFLNRPIPGQSLEEHLKNTLVIKTQLEEFEIRKELAICQILTDVLCPFQQPQ